MSIGSEVSERQNNSKKYICFVTDLQTEKLLA